MRLVTCLILVFLSGCGSAETLKLIPVSGKLKVNGKPLPGVAVQLMPVKGSFKAGSEPPPSVGVTDDDGNFVVRSSSGNRGAPAGKYKVVLAVRGADSEKKSSGSAASKDDMYKQQYQSMQKVMETIKKTDKERAKEFPFPKEFASEDTTPREIEIKDQSFPLDLDL